MPGKSPKTHYLEMRNVAEASPGGSARLKAEIIPGIMAWLIMLSNRYTKTANAMMDRYVTRTVPQLKGSAERMNQAAEHLIWLAKELPMYFPRSEYADAAAQVAAAIGLRPEQVPGWDLDWTTCDALFPAVPHASDEDGSAGTVRPGVASGEVGPGRCGEPSEVGPAGDRGADSGGVPDPPPDRDRRKRARRTQRRATRGQQSGGGSDVGERPAE